MKTGMILKDDELEAVNGGTMDETMELADKLRTNDPDELKRRLLTKYTIRAELNDSPDQNNLYQSAKTGECLSHEQVLNMIRR